MVVCSHPAGWNQKPGLPTVDAPASRSSPAPGVNALVVTTDWPSLPTNDVPSDSTSDSVPLTSSAPEVSLASWAPFFEAQPAARVAMVVRTTAERAVLAA